MNETIAHVTATVTHVIVGVDTHKDRHVAVAIDGVGRRLGDIDILTNRSGYKKLVDWADSHGSILMFGIEGTGSWGAGLTRYLRRDDITVVEVNRPDRAARRRTGKSDPVDAEAAARAALAGIATGTPKGGDDQVEMIRQLRIGRSSAGPVQWFV